MRPLIFILLFPLVTLGQGKEIVSNLGGGIQYLKANLKQYETVAEGADDITNQRTDIKITELQFSAGLGFNIAPFPIYLLGLL